MRFVRSAAWPFPPWWVAGAMVTAGWISGFFLWRMPDGPEQYGTYFDVWIPAAMLVLGAPTAAIAAALRSSAGGVRHALGSVLMWLTAIGLAYLASFAFFGGFCLDENDACITTWASRVTSLAAALGVLTIAGGGERLIRTRSGNARTARETDGVRA